MESVMQPLTVAVSPLPITPIASNCGPGPERMLRSVVAVAVAVWASAVPAMKSPAVAARTVVARADFILLSPLVCTSKPWGRQGYRRDPGNGLPDLPPRQNERRAGGFVPPR